MGGEEDGLIIIIIIMSDKPFTKSEDNSKHKTHAAAAAALLLDCSLQLFSRHFLNVHNAHEQIQLLTTSYTRTNRVDARDLTPVWQVIVILFSPEKINELKIMIIVFQYFIVFSSRVCFSTHYRL